MRYTYCIAHFFVYWGSIGWPSQPWPLGPKRPSAAQPWPAGPDQGAKRRRAEQTCERRSIAAASFAGRGPQIL